MTDYKKWEEIEASIPDDEDDKARQRLKEQKANMSDNEVRRLHECWEKPEFKAMFQEYADEVSDPTHKAETEKYLAQCEAEQRAERDAKDGYLHGRSASEFDSLKNSVPGQPEAPDGQQLLKPSKGFVVKTWQKTPGKSDFDRETGKFFINVCSHEEIDKPTAQDVTAPDGRKGQTWSMPHLCSPTIKDEKDKAGHKCAVVDIVFNTEVLRRIDAPQGYGERWKGMVAKTALEMVCKLHELELDMEEHKLLNMKYFGDTGEGPSTLSWRPSAAFEESEPPKAKRSPKAQAAAAESAPKPATTQGAPKATSQATNSSGGGDASQPPPPPKASAAAPAKPKAPRTRAPKYSIVHRGVGDIGSAWNDTKLSSSGRPRELCVKLELPELSSAGEIDLDITERKLEMKHTGVGYELSLPLPFPVLSDQGSAKFDKAKRVLTVTLPVAAAAAPMPQWQPAEKGQSEEERAIEEAAEKAAEAEARAAAEAAETARRAEERAAREAKAKQEEDARESRRLAAIAAAEREAARRAEQQASSAAKPKPKPAAVKAPKALEEKAAGKAEERANESDASTTSTEWVEVSDAELAAAKAASPGKERPPKAEVVEQKPPPSTAAAATKAEPPAAPTGKEGLPAFSNSMLFELD